MRYHCRFVVIFIFVFLGGIWTAQAQISRESLEQKRQELQKEIGRISQLRSSNKQKERSVLNEVEDLNQQIQSTENLIKVTNQQANLLTREINTNQSRISRLRKDLEQLKEDYSNMIEKSYKSKSSQSRIMFLLSSQNFLQAYKRLQYMKQYTNYRKQQGEEIQARTNELQQLNKDLVEQKQQKEVLISENRKTRAELEKNRKAQQELMRTIRSKESQFATQIKKRQQEINEIDRQIEKMIRESIAKTNEESGSTSRDTYAMTPEARALAADFVSNKGKLPWPVRSGVIASKFGTQPHPIVRSITINNNGISINTGAGNNARAVFNGTVSEVQVLKGANKAVMIRHGDYISIYNNLSKVFVKRGDVIVTGQELGEIATSSTTGKTTLHFLVYKNTQKMNPEDWIIKM